MVTSGDCCLGCHYYILSPEPSHRGHNQAAPGLGRAPDLSPFSHSFPSSLSLSVPSAENALLQDLRAHCPTFSRSLLRCCHLSACA